MSAEPMGAAAGDALDDESIIAAAEELLRHARPDEAPELSEVARDLQPTAVTIGPVRLDSNAVHALERMEPNERLEVLEHLNRMRVGLPAAPTRRVGHQEDLFEARLPSLRIVYTIVDNSIFVLLVSRARSQDTRKEQGKKPRVFVSYSRTDDRRIALQQALSNNFDLVSSDTLTGSVRRHTALRRALEDVDVAVILPPAPGNLEQSNVIFEAGAAAGAGVPLVIVSDPTVVPMDLASSATVDVEHLDSLPETISLLARRQRVAGEKEEAGPAPALTPEYARQWLGRLQQAGTEQEALPLIDDLFRHAGARTRRVEHATDPVTDRADLVVWEDSLLATFGVPLPIELLLRWRGWPAIRSRLEKTLVASGSQSLLALVLESTDVPRVWSDGRRTILVASAAALADALTTASLSKALSSLLSAAIP